MVVVLVVVVLVAVVLVAVLVVVLVAVHPAGLLQEVGLEPELPEPELAFVTVASPFELVVGAPFPFL